MTLPQQKLRELVFLLLYSHDMSQANDNDMINLLMRELAVTKKAVTTAQEKMKAIIEKKKEIDDMIAKASESYSFERIPTVELNILRLGVFEMLFDTSTPPKVSIVEALRLARKFSTEESSTFINAILDNIYKQENK